ncbi:hypothetical protein JRO89_XS04G0018900 [Xanthoceras sorbifolium]|uniref:Acyl carrier protein n=1 Tax=Xanthoceras sorbifolium TaxID=99658 RepID=A0ABQ8I3U3_9ROSI|nr:hypothetical protein JRO89_XS04G0018900 [Xanthoceras sorbifolium]
MAARGALLKYLRVNVIPRNPTAASGGDTGLFSVAFNAVRRRFSTEEVRGSFLDKSEVSDRIVSVVKNFQKVDPSKGLLGRLSVRLHQKPISIISKMMALEEEFGFEIPDNEADKISSIDLAVDFIASHPQAK